jgi:hypothetical protein
MGEVAISDDGSGRSLYLYPGKTLAGGSAPDGGVPTINGATDVGAPWGYSLAGVR